MLVKYLKVCSCNPPHEQAINEETTSLYQLIEEKHSTKSNTHSWQRTTKQQLPASESYIKGEFPQWFFKNLQIPHRLIICNKCTVLVGDIDNVAGCGYVDANVRGTFESILLWTWNCFKAQNIIRTHTRTHTLNFYLFLIYSSLNTFSFLI